MVVVEVNSAHAEALYSRDAKTLRNSVAASLRIKLTFKIAKNGMPRNNHSSHEANVTF